MRKWLTGILIISLVLIVAIGFLEKNKTVVIKSDLLKEEKQIEKVKPKIIDDKQEDMNSLLKHIGFAEEALGKFTIQAPQEAVNLWSEGVFSGNGVIQYATMDKILQQEFKSYLQNKKNLSWNTKTEDFNINNFEITEDVEVSERIKIYTVKFNYEDKNGIKGEWFNKITVTNENDNWVISLIR